jgi:hypothetical protein
MYPNSFRPEHPRPDFQRSLWFNLNGRWDFCFDPLNQGLENGLYFPGTPGFNQEINVPFPWQSDLAGLDERQPACEIAWYRRTFLVPPEMAGQEIFLRFGAVDFQANVWVNGQVVGDHEGGYLPFEFNISAVLASGENNLVVRVQDPLDLREIPHGKQMNRPKNIWYECMFSPTGGIWQTVWLEARPSCHLQTVRITPNVDQSSAHFSIDLVSQEDCLADLSVIITSPFGKTITHSEPVKPVSGRLDGVQFVLPIPDPILWDTDHPELYSVELVLSVDGKSDRVQTYFGMRSIATQDGKIVLNGKPIYLMSALDQGYWAEGMFTAPSDEALRQDILLAKQFGLNSLRKHIKFEDPRYYYWADRLGLLIWQDAPSPTTFSSLACSRLLADQLGVIQRDYNHPSIFLWCPYNETWGLEYDLENNPDMQRWIDGLYTTVRNADQTRLVVDNSGWDHVRTDLADIHFYVSDIHQWRETLDTLVYRPDESSVVLGNPDQPATMLRLPFYARGYHHQSEPVIMSEYGTGWKSDRSWDMKWQTNEMRRYPEITGYVYTEIYDIEHEFAGFLTYQRQLKQTGYDPRMIHSPDFVVLDVASLGQVYVPAETVTVDVSFSAYGQPPLERARLVWKVIPVTSTDPQRAPAVFSGVMEFTARQYNVTPLTKIVFQVPESYSHLQLWAWVEDEDGNERAANFLDFAIRAPRLPRLEALERGTLGETILRFSPGAEHLAQHFTATMTLDTQVEAVFGTLSGNLEYSIPFPEISSDSVQYLELAFEAGPWPSELSQSTNGIPRPTTLTVLINDTDIGELNLYDLHIHSGGALTRLNQLGPGEHGDLIRLNVPPDLARAAAACAELEGCFRVRFEVQDNARNRGGLILFGQNSGKFGLDPTLRVATQLAKEK